MHKVWVYLIQCRKTGASRNEHGPAGGVWVWEKSLRPAIIYGWPVITNGLDYSGARISPFTEYPGMANKPWLDWTPLLGRTLLIGCLLWSMFYLNLQGDSISDIT